MNTWPAKDPQEVADYSWTPSLDTGDTISSIATSVVSGTVAIDSDDNSDSVATVWLSGGTAGETAIVRIAVTTADGRTFEQDFALEIVERSDSTLAAFRVRFPAFAAVPDETVKYWLTEGASETSNWSADNTRAQLLYAAHKIAEAGLGRGAIAQGVTSFKSGTFQAQISDSSASRTGFSATPYGREFLQLARRHFGGPRLAWEPSASA